MKRKIEIISLSIIIIVLISFIIILMNNGQTSKQIRKSLNFLEKLEEVKAIDEETIPKGNEVIEIGNTETGGLMHQYTIEAGRYRVNLDEKYNIIGFTNRIEKSETKKKIDTFKAVELASKYINSIAADAELGEVISKPDEEKTYYTISFYNIYENYRNYNNEMLVQIHENTGELLGYSMVYMESNNYNGEIGIRESTAQNIVEKYYQDKGIIGEVVKIDKQGYIYIDDEISQLCYVINFEVTLENNSKSINKVFVSTKDGEIVKEVVMNEEIGIVE